MMMTDKGKKLIFALALTAVAALLVFNEFRILALPQTAVIAADQDMANVFLYRMQVWIAAIGTLAIYSFMFKENPVYRGFEHALLGCATGFGCAVIARQVLYEKLLLPVAQGFQQWRAVGISADALSDILLIIPGVIGLLWYFQYSKKYFWVSRIAMCIVLGAGSGLAFKGTFNQLIPQITGTFKNLWPGEYAMPGATILQRASVSFENVVFLVGTLSVLSYFFFAFGRKNLTIKSSANLGRWYLMITLGAFFGNTFMTRLSALVERVHFLVAEWLRLVAM